MQTFCPSDGSYSCDDNSTYVCYQNWKMEIQFCGPETAIPRSQRFGELFVKFDVSCFDILECIWLSFLLEKVSIASLHIFFQLILSYHYFECNWVKVHSILFSFLLQLTKRPAFSLSKLVDCVHSSSNHTNAWNGYHSFENHSK